MTFQEGLSPPFFVFGAPRSGTTFLAEVLNRHPRIILTNELRVMTYTNRVLNRLSQDKWILLNGRRGFLDHLRREMPAIIEGYYRALGATSTTRWGDKNPHYADSKSDPECLGLINDLFPQSQFVNVIRDGREVVSSILAKEWGDLESAIDVWRRHIEHARNFAKTVPADRFLNVRYEDLVERPFHTTKILMRFLGLPSDENVEKFLASQEVERTPYSGPTSHQIGVRTGYTRLDYHEKQIVGRRLGSLLDEIGYG